jgi:hypothetical protein
MAPVFSPTPEPFVGAMHWAHFVFACSQLWHMLVLPFGTHAAM